LILGYILVSIKWKNDGRVSADPFLYPVVSTTTATAIAALTVRNILFKAAAFVISASFVALAADIVVFACPAVPDLVFDGLDLARVAGYLFVFVLLLPCVSLPVPHPCAETRWVKNAAAMLEDMAMQWPVWHPRYTATWRM